MNETTNAAAADVAFDACSCGAHQVVLDARPAVHGPVHGGYTVNRLEDDVHRVAGLCEALEAVEVTLAVVIQRGSLLGQTLAGLHFGLSLHPSVARAFGAAPRRPEAWASRIYCRRRSTADAGRGAGRE